MKKLLIIILIVISSTIQAQDSTGHFTIKLTTEQIQVLWNLLDQSNGSHSDVKSIMEILSRQFNAQVRIKQPKEAIEPKKEKK